MSSLAVGVAPAGSVPSLQILPMLLARSSLQNLRVEAAVDVRACQAQRRMRE